MAGQSQSQAGNQPQLFPTEAAAPDPQTRILTAASKLQVLASELRMLGSGRRRKEAEMEHEDRAQGAEVMGRGCW